MKSKPSGNGTCSNCVKLKKTIVETAKEIIARRKILVAPRA
jgi:hypothetical protein